MNAKKEAFIKNAVEPTKGQVNACPFVLLIFTCYAQVFMVV